MFRVFDGRIRKKVGTERRDGCMSILNRRIEIPIWGWGGRIEFLAFRMDRCRCKRAE